MPALTPDLFYRQPGSQVLQYGGPEVQPVVPLVQPAPAPSPAAPAIGAGVPGLLPALPPNLPASQGPAYNLYNQALAIQQALAQPQGQFLSALQRGLGIRRASRRGRTPQGMAQGVDAGLLAIPEIAALFTPEGMGYNSARTAGLGDPGIMNAAAQALASLLGS